MKSGLFQPNLTSGSTVQNIWKVIVRRFKVLIIPYFASGLLLWSVTSRPSFYWFLLVLFEFVIINLVISYVASKFRQKANYIEGALFLSTFLAIHVITSRYKRYEMLPLLDIGHLSYYQFFTIGYLVAKYRLLDRIFCNWGYTLSLVLFVCLYITFRHIGIKLTIGGIVISPLLPLLAIYTIFFLFRSMDTSKTAKVLNWMGRHSLEIYILHFFFLFKIPFIGDFIHDLASVGGVNSCLLQASVHLS